MSKAASTTTALLAARPINRRQTAPSSNSQRRAPKSCQPLPHSIEALDLSNSSPTQTLASIRFLVLSYLADLEAQLALLESPDVETWKSKGELTIEEAAQWIRTAFEMLDSIRTDVCHLPELHLTDLSVEIFKSHLPDLPDVPSMEDVRSHFPDMAEVRSHLPDVRSRFPNFDLAEMRSKLDDVRTRFNDIDFRSYIPILSKNIDRLHSHLTSMELPSSLDFASFAPNSLLSDLLDSVLASDLLSDIVDEPSEPEEGDDLIERAAKEVRNAVKRSLEGVHLIQYSDLPERWRNNPFVVQGYRFIPLERWPLIIMSLFAFHNETLNIHTHLIPFFLWSLNSIPFWNPSGLIDTPEKLFMTFALLCLFCSAVWHTMAGCAHYASVEFCARVDYVGIGWLISASVGTVVHYGFQCHPSLGNAFLLLCLGTGAAGNIVPFTEWFNDYDYRGWRVVFFLGLAFSSLAPLATMAALYSTGSMLKFIAPVVPSLLSYCIGLLFYMSHVPERFLSEKWCKRLDVIGGGSHAIWHCFIVLAVSQHKAAIRLMKEGIQCPTGI
ncbi:hemolysin-III related-domain-containing protein [Mycena floridula]|nr:hemolysin-III related-domain-containing protein [Mycena floridula]